MADLKAHDLERFIDAQAGAYGAALAELVAGRKRSHWMWFIFPQLRGLGRSPTAQFYGLASRDEASAYLAHPILCERLETCTEVVLQHAARPLREIFGAPDDLKFISSMTLFGWAAGGGIYPRALDTFNSGALDPRTLERLAF